MWQNIRSKFNFRAQFLELLDFLLISHFLERTLLENVDQHLFYLCLGLKEFLAVLVEVHWLLTWNLIPQLKISH